MKKHLLILLITSSLCSYSQTNTYQRVDEILAAQVDSEFGPGLTVGIVKGGELVYQNSKGFMNLEYSVPFNDSTVFGIASITKQFTSACIALLVNQGKLSVDDDVRKTIPELAFYGDTIRIKHLLNHTSGLRNHNVLLDLAGFDYAHRGYTNEMIQELMFRQSGVNNKPGDKMLYSNTNYVLLALIVERVSGLEIHDFAEKELFVPLGMNNTRYRSDLTSVIKNRACSYYKEGSEFKQPKSLTLCVGAGGVGSTVSDLAVWSHIFLDSEHDFSFVADFITKLDTLNDGGDMQHARGMFVTPYKGLTTLNHSGRDLGMRSQLICVPDLDLGVIVFTNSEHINAVNTSYNILDLWVKEVSQENSSAKDSPLLKRELSGFTGDYQELNSDLRMQISLDNDTLYAKSSFGRNATKLIAISNESFVRIDNASVKYTFLSEENSESDLLVDFGGAIFYFERVELTETPNQNVSDFAGTFQSKELDVEYKLSASNNELILSYPFNDGILLSEGEEDVFGSNRRTKYSFIRDNTGKVVSFNVASEGTVKNILFERVK